MRVSFRLIGLRGCLAAAVLAATVAASPAPAASDAAAPVAISACRGGIASIELIEIASYDVTFRDTAAVAADEIRFSIRYGRHDKRADFDVHGTFAPGIEVTQHLRRTLRGGLYSYASDQNDCFVDYVHFRDGTSWSRPSRHT